MIETRPGEAGAAGARGDLLVAVGDGRVLTRAIDRDDLVIGRDASCDFVIEHPSLSRRHARVQFGAPSTLLDLGSTNGVWVAGRRLRGGEPVPLAASFQIGPFSFSVVARTQVSQVSAVGRHELRVEDPTPNGLPSLTREFAATTTNILITGETGVGKEILATSLHALSGRSGPLIQVNCAALNESLLENELFGHERGAFTGAVSRSAGLIEAAQGGTLMLDEIGEMPLSTQAKLLRVIEHREVFRLGATRPVAVDVRFLAATNRDLVAEVSRRTFRQDLFFRLDGVTIAIPPLRERLGMIIPLATEFLARARGVAQAELAADVAQVLIEYPWPGNVRELKAVIERAAVIARDRPLARRHLLLGRAAQVSPAPAMKDDDDRARIVRALDECGGNQSRAAKLLGISRTTMITKLRIYQIKRPTVRAR